MSIGVIQPLLPMLCDVRNVTRASSSTTVLWPGDYVELEVPPDLGEEHVLALQPRTDTPVPKYTKTTSIWPEPQILEAVGAKVRLVNSSQEPKLIGRHKHLSQILPTEETSSFTSTLSLSSLPQPVKPKSSLPFWSSVSIDPDNILSEDQTPTAFADLWSHLGS